MANSPLAQLKDKFGDKAKLVAELEKLTKGDDLWVSRLNAKKGLAHVSNAKLLRLHATFSAVKEKFGTRAKLIDAIAVLEKRAKDEGYKIGLGKYPVPRLWDMWRSSTKRIEAPAKAAKVKSAPKKAVVAKVAAVKAVAQTANQVRSAAAAKKRKN